MKTLTYSEATELGWTISVPNERWDWCMAEKYGEEDEQTTIVRKTLKETLEIINKIEAE